MCHSMNKNIIVLQANGKDTIPLEIKIIELFFKPKSRIIKKLKLKIPFEIKFVD